MMTQGNTPSAIGGKAAQKKAEADALARKREKHKKAESKRASEGRNRKIAAMTATELAEYRERLRAERRARYRALGSNMGTSAP
jgi:hypothetical protein